MSTRLISRCSAFVLALCAAACGSADGGTNAAARPAAATGGSTSTAAGGTGNVAAGGTPVASGGTTPAPLPTTGRTNDANVTFDWPSVNPQAGSCKPGFYLGSFTGMYASQFTAVGMPIPVAGDVNMFLAKSANGESLTIQNGAVCGMADGVFPFYGDLVGELDCTTGQLTATMKGGYLVAGAPGPFEGWISSGYNFLTQQLDTGIWCLKEGAAAGPNDCPNGAWPLPYGGSGNWNATWQSDTPGTPCARPAGL